MTDAGKPALNHERESERPAEEMVMTKTAYNRKQLKQQIKADPKKPIDWTGHNFITYQKSESMFSGDPLMSLALLNIMIKYRIRRRKWRE